jgi:hypothetical protein
LPDFSCYNIPKYTKFVQYIPYTEKYTKLPQYIPNGHKINEMDVK